MKKIVTSAAAIVAAALIMKAEIKMPAVFCDNMVIQRETQAAIWGKATPGSKVTVSASWTAESVTTKADTKTGRWNTTLQTPPAGGPYEITISEAGAGAVTLKNVLSGEVWFCSGQSNMDMPMYGYGSMPTAGAADRIVTAKPSRPIRICKVKLCSSATEKDDVACSWQEHTPNAVAQISAVAYFFADAVQQVIDVPVGIIVSAWGGSSIQTWICRDVIEKEYAADFKLDGIDDAITSTKQKNTFPTLLYNGQVAGLVPFTFKGMIWYQGETNRGRPELYKRLQTSYAKMMRAHFNVPDAPFYFVQLAPYSYGDPTSFISGYFHEAQQHTLETIPNSGMAVTVDLGEVENIHPCRKQEVGKRLAYLALQHTYGMNAIAADAPTYKSVEFKDGRSIITVNCDHLGVGPMGVALSGFEVASDDKVFYPATGACNVRGFKKNQIVVSCPQVSNPVAVRYCFRNWSVGTVFNNYGIPLAPFRTDDWDGLQH